jgi:DNA polymerase-3 subunit gamma/tau
MLGLVEEERYLELLEMVSTGDRAAVFPFVQSLLDEGYDLGEFVQGLGDTLRAVLALRLDPESDPAELSLDFRDALAAVGRSFAAEDLLRLLVATADFESTGRFRRSAQPRIQVEVLLLRLVSLESSVDLNELLALLDAPGEASSRDVPEKPRRSRKVEPAPPTRPAREKRPPGRSESSPATPSSSGASQEQARKPSDESAAPRTERAPADVRSAWSEALEAARGSAPGGKWIGLRGATVTGYSDGELELEIPPGLAGDLREYLGDSRRSAALRAELGTRLGIDPASLGFRIADGGSSGRITAKSARDLKLKRLVETDPRLREAVETLDLKLTEE